MLYLKDKIEKEVRSTNSYILNSNDYKYSRLIAMLYMTILLAATVLAYRIVLIGSIAEPGSTLVYTCSFFIANIYAEVYGIKLAKSLVIESVICGYLFALLLIGINSLPAPIYWDNTGSFDSVLGHVLRFTNAGVLGYLISAYLNIYLITKWKLKMNGRLFWLRSILASSISEGVATFIAGAFTFIGMLPSKNIVLIILNAWGFKIIYGFIAVWPASYAAYILKNKEIEFYKKTSNNFLGTSG